jgi:methionyl-tRNA formyltransferase
MGSPDFAVPSLLALASSHEVVGIYTRAAKPAGRRMELTPTPVETAARALNIPLFTPKTFRGDAGVEAVLELSALKPDYIIVFAYSLILPREVLDIAPCACVHPSLLPLWRGPNPIMRAVESGVGVTGICLMQMDEGMDTGPVLSEQEFSIADLTRGEVEAEIAELTPKMLLEYLSSPLDFPPMPQAGEATYAAKISSGEKKIDIGDALNYYKILALAPYPCAWFEDANKKRVKVLRAKLSEGKLSLLEVQPEGKKPMAYSEYVNGLKGRVNDLCQKSGGWAGEPA